MAVTSPAGGVRARGDPKGQRERQCYGSDRDPREDIALKLRPAVAGKFLADEREPA